MILKIIFIFSKKGASFEENHLMTTARERRLFGNIILIPSQPAFALSP
jgi:hypothetical protein